MLLWLERSNGLAPHSDLTCFSSSSEDSTLFFRLAAESLRSGSGTAPPLPSVGFTAIPSWFGLRVERGGERGGEEGRDDDGGGNGDWGGDDGGDDEPGVDGVEEVDFLFLRRFLPPVAPVGGSEFSII